jgi:hypothetical protein
MVVDHAREDRGVLEGGGDRAALLDGGDDVAHGALDHRVARGLAGDLEGLQERDAGETRALRVRDQRARATFWTMSPIFIGMRRRKASHWARPLTLVRQRLNAMVVATVAAIMTYQ